MEFLKRLEGRRRWLWMRLQACIRIKSYFRGWLARRRLKLMHLYATKLQAQFRGYQVRMRIAEEQIRKALGVHVETVYHRGHTISGRYLIIKGTQHIFYYFTQIYFIYLR